MSDRLLRPVLVPQRRDPALEGAAITERDLSRRAHLPPAATESAPVAITEMRPSTGGLASRQATPTAPQPSETDWAFCQQRGSVRHRHLLVFALSSNPNQRRVVNTANTGTLLALAAMAQTIPVLTAGLDLSVGMVLVLANCLASTLMNGSPLQTAAGVLAVLVVGLLCGAINGSIVVYGRLQPIIATPLPARFIVALHSG
jgi:hypothetical protein